MKLKALVAAAAILVPASGFAADLAVKAPPIIIPVYNWTGFYVGVNAGYAWSDGSFDFSGTDTGPGGFGSVLAAGGIPANGVDAGNGFTIGGQVGFNYQVGATVFGIEADLNWVDFGTQTSAITITAPGFVPVTTATQRSMDYFGTVRARAGFLPTERLYTYVTAGLAYGNPSMAFAVTAPLANPPLAVAASDETNIGYTVGAGFEYAFADHWSFKTEYLYYDLGDTSATVFYNYGANRSSLIANASNTGNIVRGGVNYKF